MDNQNTVGTQFRALRIIHIALCVGVLLILSVFRYLVKQESDVVPDKNLIVEILGVAIGFVCVIAARFLFFVRTKAGLSVVTLKEKINIFRGAFILQMALLEGVFKGNVGFRVHAERRAVRQAHDRVETQPGLTHRHGGGLVHDEAQMRGARMGHCRVPAEVVSCPLYDRAG